MSFKVPCVSSNIENLGILINDSNLLTSERISLNSSLFNSFLNDHFNFSCATQIFFVLKARVISTYSSVFWFSVTFNQPSLEG